MFPNQFDYHRPDSVQAAASLLAADPDAKLLAGGHSLLPAMKLRLASPSSLVDLGGIDGLVGIDASGKITIGAMTTYAMLRDSRELSRVLPMVTEAADNVGDPAVQARGTLGGALAHSDPAADFTAIFLALNGSVDVTGAQGSRTIAADELFVDLFTTALQPDEIITSVSFQAPARAPAWRTRSSATLLPATRWSAWRPWSALAPVERSTGRGSPSPGRRARRRVPPMPNRPWSESVSTPSRSRPRRRWPAMGWRSTATISRPRSTDGTSSAC